MADIKELEGVILSAVHGSVGDEQMTFIAEDGREWRMYHDQDCCESVALNDIAGSLADLIGSPILQAEESTNSEDKFDGQPEYPDSFTWTFYRISTAKGLVVLRWLGESNGYYSESVEFERLAS